MESRVLEADMMVPACRIRTLQAEAGESSAVGSLHYVERNRLLGSPSDYNGSRPQYAETQFSPHRGANVVLRVWVHPLISLNES